MSGRKTCVLCQRSHPKARCTAFELTPSEEASLVKRGASMPDEFVYCNQCWEILKDPETGPQLMRDAAERQMLKIGAPPARAREMADKYYAKLLDGRRQRHHKVH